jgi:predicted RNA binding protein YcfA (HicA-like mRNA interferase family)
MPGIHRAAAIWEEGNERRGGSLKIREAIRMIVQDGWYPIITRGSHRQYKHATKPGRVTISGKMSDDIAPGTLNSILKQARLKGEK